MVQIGAVRDLTYINRNSSIIGKGANVEMTSNETQIAERRQEKSKQPFLKQFFIIYIPLVLQTVITLAVNLTDNIMLGAYSEAALSGVTAVNQIQFIYQQLLFALGDGLVIFCSQYWGQKKTDPMKKISSVSMRAGLGVAIVLFALLTIFPQQAVGLFTTDGAIIAEGVKYMNIVKYSYLFFAVSILLLAALRSVETVKIALYTSIMTFFVNCGINYVLIYGKFGAPEMGAAGAAIGTFAARVLEFIVVLIYVLKIDKKLKLRVKDYLKIDKILTKDYFKVCTPMLFVQGLWGLNTALQTVILGHMTSAAIAANSAANASFMLVKATSVGAASAASVIIGKTIGTGDLERVKTYSKKLQFTFITIGVLSGIALYFLRIPILQLYDLTYETKKMADQFLMILSVVNIGMAYQMPTNQGIIRGGGSAMFVVKLDLISIWAIVLPLSFIMAFVVKASPTVVVCCLNADQIFKCVPAFIKANYGKWIKQLTR